MSEIPQIWTNEIPRDYDHLKGWRWLKIREGMSQLDIFGGIPHGPGAAGVADKSALGLNPAGPIVGGPSPYGGFTAPAGNPGGPGGTTSAGSGLVALIGGCALHANSTGLTANVDAGTIYVLGSTDASALPSGTPATPQTLDLLPQSKAAGVQYSDLAGANSEIGVGAADQSSILLRCTVNATSLTGIVIPPTGYFAAYLIYATPVASDVTDADDPNLQPSESEALIPYYEASNPGTPFGGPGGDGALQATARANYATLALLAGANETTFAAAVANLAVPANAVPLYVVVSSGAYAANLNAQSVFIPGRGTWLTNGPGGGPLTFASGTPYAPFVSGLLQQHHQGVPGMAPKIDGGTEWAPQAAVYNDSTGGSGTGSSEDFLNARDIGLTRALRASGVNVPAHGNAPTAPSIVLGSAPASSVSRDTHASDTAGQVSVTFASGSIPVGVTVLASLSTNSGFSPEAVALTPMGTGESGFSAVGLQFGWEADVGGWSLIAVNSSGAAIAVGAITITWSYIAIY